MYRILCLLIGYAIGCIQVAYIIGKLSGGIDIREHGSGNAGTTNVVRVLGPKTGLIVFILDIFKGMAGFLVCTFIFSGGSSFFSGELGILPGLYGSLGIILGHDFPIQMKWKGGKGSAATIGIIFWLDWRIALICYAAGFIAVAATRYISLASMTIAVLMAITLFAFGYPAEAYGIGILFAGLSLYQHRGNIGRLIKGNERKFFFKKQPE